MKKLVFIFMLILVSLFIIPINYARFLPAKCQLPAGIACMDFYITPNNVQIVLRNGMGFDINPISITIPECSSTSVSISDDAFDCSPATSALLNGEKCAYTLTCDSKFRSDRFTSDIIVEYTNVDSGLTNEFTGVMVGQIEKSETQILMSKIIKVILILLFFAVIIGTYFIKKIRWCFWFFLIFSIFLVIGILNMGRWYDFFNNFWFYPVIFFIFFASPFFFAIGLFINIRRNKAKKKKLTSDWAFWVWLILLILPLVYWIYFLFRLLIEKFY